MLAWSRDHLDLLSTYVMTFLMPKHVLIVVGRWATVMANDPIVVVGVAVAAAVLTRVLLVHGGCCKTNLEADHFSRRETYEGRENILSGVSRHEAMRLVSWLVIGPVVSLVTCRQRLARIGR